MQNCHTIMRVDHILVYLYACVIAANSVPSLQLGKDYPVTVSAKEGLKVTDSQQELLFQYIIRIYREMPYIP